MASFAVQRSAVQVRSPCVMRSATTARRGMVGLPARKVVVASRTSTFALLPACKGMSSKVALASTPLKARMSTVSKKNARMSVTCQAAEGESSNPVTALFKKYPAAETIMYFGVWYFLNVKFNILNKQVYNYFPFPWFVSVIHLAAGLVIASVFWATKLVKFEAPDEKFLKAVVLVALCHAIGHSLTNVSFASVAVSFTHTIKTLEPVFSSIGSYLVNGQVYSLPVYMSLLPIMAGVMICSATELSFTWLGFSCAMASNVLFAARAIFSKKLMGNMNPVNVYNYVSMIALLFCIPPVFIFEWSTLGAGMTAAAAKVGASKFYWDLWNVGMYYHLYNQVAYQALGKVEPVTHAVGNVGKRIFVIGFSIIAFGNKISTQSIVGSLIAIAGAGLYGYLKGLDAQKTGAPAH